MAFPPFSERYRRKVLFAGSVTSNRQLTKTFPFPSGIAKRPRSRYSIFRCAHSGATRNKANKKRIRYLSKVFIKIRFLVIAVRLIWLNAPRNDGLFYHSIL